MSSEITPGVPFRPVQEDLTIAVVAHNEQSRIEICLRSLLLFGTLQILVIDNASSDQTPSLLNELTKKHPNRLRVLSNPVNHLGVARKLAAINATTKYLGFIDADCLVSETTGPQQLLSLFELNDDPRLLAMGSGNKLPPPRNFFSAALAIALRSVFAHGRSLQQFLPSARREVLHIPTCNILYHRERLLLAGAFSEKFARCGEDLEFHIRARKLGFTLRYEPGFEVEHARPESLISWGKKMFQYGEAQISVGLIHFRHFVSPRMLPLLALLSGLAALLISRQGALILFLFYFLSMMGLGFGLAGWPQRRLGPLVGLIFIVTHFAYGLGELTGLLKTPLRGPLSRP